MVPVVRSGDDVEFAVAVMSFKLTRTRHADRCRRQKSRNRGGISPGEVAARILAPLRNINLRAAPKASPEARSACRRRLCHRR